MPHTSYVINNLCVKNNNIYLVDLVLYENKSKEYILHIIEINMDKLVA